MTAIPRFSQLSLPRQALVRLCQDMNFGEIRDIEVRDGEPMFGSAPIVLIDVNLDSDEGMRPEAAIPDFELRREVCQLMSRLDEIRDGRIERIEVRAGLPRRISYERPAK